MADLNRQEAREEHSLAFCEKWQKENCPALAARAAAKWLVVANPPQNESDTRQSDNAQCQNNITVKDVLTTRKDVLTVCLYYITLPAKLQLGRFSKQKGGPNRDDRRRTIHKDS